jgi:hypothetical protein
MPQRKARKRPQDRTLVRVTLPEHERAVIGKVLLQTADRQGLDDNLLMVERLLTELASEQANSTNVVHRSDLIAEVAPVAKAARSLHRVLKRMHPAAAQFMALQGGVAQDCCLVELEKIEQFEQWIHSAPSKKGGERASYEKSLRARWAGTLGGFFDVLYKGIHGDAGPKKGWAARRRNFVTLSIAAIEAALHAAGAK